MKKVTVIAILAVFLIFAKFSFSQSVGINTASPNTSAALEINSFTGAYQGILIPQVPLNNRVVINSSISDAPTGLLVYNTSTVELDNMVPGFYYAAGGRWQELVSNDRLFGFAAYGEIFEAHDFNLGVNYPLTLGTWSPWITAEAGTLENVTLYTGDGTDYIEVTESGAYQVNLAVSYQGDNSMQVVIQAWVDPFAPGEPDYGVSKIQVHNKLQANGDLVSGAASGVVTLLAGDKMYVQFMCTNATKNIQVEVINLSIAKISE